MFMHFSSSSSALKERRVRLNSGWVRILLTAAFASASCTCMDSISESVCSVYVCCVSPGFANVDSKTLLVASWRLTVLMSVALGCVSVLVHAVLCRDVLGDGQLKAQMLSFYDCCSIESCVVPAALFLLWIWCCLSQPTQMCCMNVVRTLLLRLNV